MLFEQSANKTILILFFADFLIFIETTNLDN